MKFIKYSAIAAGLLAGAAACAAQEVNVMVDAAKPGAVINKNIYGQFAEHLGTGIYGGMWVGPESKIPNIKGWRKDVVAALKDLQVPVVRWPGGCFADEYYWRDGIGPRDERPIKVNTNWGGVEDNNAVGTHEFFDLRGKDGTLYVSLVNTNPKEEVEVSLGVAGAKAKAANGSVLTAAAMDAHNTFASPKVVVPAPFQANVDNGKLVMKLPAKSVTVVAVRE